MLKTSLRGRSIIVVGGGLAGLTAAIDLQRYGAQVTVIEARPRVGGRVLTLRGAFAGGQYAEAGGDLIDQEQHEIRHLAQGYGLKLDRILRQGFSFVRQADRERRRGRLVSGERPWNRLAKAVAPWAQVYRCSEGRWDSAVAHMLARQSVAEWLDDVQADGELRAVARGLRGFFLADPEELALLVLVEQLAGNLPGREPMYRIKGGNDRLPEAMAADLGKAVQLNTIARVVRHDRNSVRLTVETTAGEQAQLISDYLIFAIPATTLRAIAIRPALPTQQAQAIADLKYGRVTKALLQFDRRFWRRGNHPRAFGTDAPTGAVWEANEGQSGAFGILTFMAGGQASEDMQKLVAQHGLSGLVGSVRWLGADRAALLHSRLVTWEKDPWAQGGYAYFSPAYDPRLRPWLARPHGRLLFAGEHTSIQWQGYMNGAVESGRRAAAEVCALASMSCEEDVERLLRDDMRAR